MRALIQRVNWASISIEQKLHAEIKIGLLAFIGMEKSDTADNADKLLDKILAYRVFSDADGKMNLNVQEVGGELMLVSQFTLAADTNKGLRPSFSSAMAPDLAEELYCKLVESAKTKHLKVNSGRFAADMQVSLENNGPVTFILEN